MGGGQVNHLGARIDEPPGSARATALVAAGAGYSV
jgi:hypothetical protein